MSGQAMCPEALEVVQFFECMRKFYHYQVVFDGGVTVRNVADIPATYIVSSSAVLWADDPVHAALLLRTGAQYERL